VARRLGAHAIININNVPMWSKRSVPTPKTNAGPDAVVEAAEIPAAWQTALSLVRRGGVVNFFSGLPLAPK